MKIATWNVNSLRVRLEHIKRFIEEQAPDVLALQEIKMETHLFPGETFREMGYHVVANGQKTYNGVATLARQKMDNIDLVFPDYTDSQSRLLSVTINQIRVINIYVPNGESIDSPKYQYKIGWLEALHRYLKQQLDQYEKVVVMGDFNIAPQDEDVHDPDVFRGQVLFSDIERKAFQDILALGFKDSFRLFSQKPKLFSWWDYRQLAFVRNAGLRIDHILLSSQLASQCENCSIDRIPRKWEKPSDHAPVICELRA